MYNVFTHFGTTAPPQEYLIEQAMHHKPAESRPEMRSLSLYIPLPSYHSVPNIIYPLLSLYYSQVSFPPSVDHPMSSRRRRVCVWHTYHDAAAHVRTCVGGVVLASTFGNYGVVCFD
eukprot:GHVU01122597.1.p1 GENE.GHVU01122597.1~~GHVU01122597.1.p1  ORF type:complete len:117 (-),score=7.59 GHVU01122597.1:22-372(-)